MACVPGKFSVEWFTFTPEPVKAIIGFVARRCADSRSVRDAALEFIHGAMRRRRSSGASPQLQVPLVASPRNQLNRHEKVA